MNSFDHMDSLAPFVAACRDRGHGLFVLVRTSNPGSAEFQSLQLAQGGTVADAVAAGVARWNEDCAPLGRYGPIGAVVGATAISVSWRPERRQASTAWFFLGTRVGLVTAGTVMKGAWGAARGDVRR